MTTASPCFSFFSSLKAQSCFRVWGGVFCHNFFAKSVKCCNYCAKCSEIIWKKVLMLGKYCKNTKVHKVTGKCQTSWAKVHKDEGKFTKLSEIVQSLAKV